MPNKTPLCLKYTSICNRLNDVTDIEIQKSAWVLVQEPGFIGFGVVELNKIYWPPYKPAGWEPDWNRVSDLRLFGEKGEWHVWRDWDGKHYARLLEFQNIRENDALTEHHFLWGTWKEESEHPDWIKLVEERGTEIWLPLAALDAELNLDKSHLPLCLKLKQIICCDPKSHLIGINDAALVGLTLKSKEVIFPPVSLDS